jgi:hypothetical protein
LDRHIVLEAERENLAAMSLKKFQLKNSPISACLVEMDDSKGGGQAYPEQLQRPQGRVGDIL